MSDLLEFIQCLVVFVRMNIEPSDRSMCSQYITVQLRAILRTIGRRLDFDIIRSESTSPCSKSINDALLNGRIQYIVWRIWTESHHIIYITIRLLPASY